MPSILRDLQVDAHFSLLLREVGFPKNRIQIPRSFCVIRNLSGAMPCLCSHRFLPPQRQKVLRALDRLTHLPQKLLQVLIPIHEINV
jgi:hypothetical protein